MKADFPRDELKPLSTILAAMKKGCYACYTAVEGDALQGYAFFYVLEEEKGRDYLFDYFAIVPELRDRGVGSAFLRLLSIQLKDALCVTGEVEDPERTEDPSEREKRNRRLSFYLNNGFLDPGIRSRLFGVDYRVLEMPVSQSHSREELRHIYDHLYHSMLPPAFYRRQFIIEPEGEAGI